MGIRSWRFERIQIAGGVWVGYICIPGTSGACRISILLLRKDLAFSGPFLAMSGFSGAELLFFQATGPDRMPPWIHLEVESSNMSKKHTSLSSAYRPWQSTISRYTSALFLSV